LSKPWEGYLSFAKLLVGMVALPQTLLIVSVIGSLALSTYSGYQRDSQEAVGGLVIAVIALTALLV
jgi:hypothetical protein